MSNLDSETFEVLNSIPVIFSKPKPPKAAAANSTPVPLPKSKDNHQFENANFYKNNDCCWIIEQKYFEEKAEDLLYKILNNKSDLLKKKENLKKLNYQNTWINVNQKIMKIINEN